MRHRLKFSPFLVLLICLAGWWQPTEIAAASRQVVDQLGRKVSLPQKIERIVALAPSITEIIFFLKQDHRLVGVTRYSDYPDQAAKLPKVGSYIQLDLERIVALKPDLCLAVKDGNPKQVIERLESMQIPVYAVDPRNFNAVLSTVTEIGALLDAQKTASRLVAGMQKRISYVERRVQKASHRPGVFFQIGITPIVAVGTDTFIHEIIERAGGKNLSAGPIPYPRFSREQVLALAPEVFIITSMARGETFERVKAEWRRWPAMPAVKENRIFLVDSDLFDRASPRLVDGLELLAKIIHPELFGDAP